jgi:DNA-binding HxlR family transcriptional regulator
LKQIGDFWREIFLSKDKAVSPDEYEEMRREVKDLAVRILIRAQSKLEESYVIKKKEYMGQCSGRARSEF